MADEHPVGEVTQLIERWLSLQSNGLQISVEELCKDQPELAQEVRRELSSIKKMDQFLEGNQDVTVPEIGTRTGSAICHNTYVIEKILGHGGCSEVYLAKDTNLGRMVAVKFLRPDTADISRLRQRLRLEAEITSQLNHPGIVSIHSSGEIDGLPFYTMQFVQGSSLAKAISSHHDGDPSKHEFLGSGLRKLLKHFVDVCQTIAFAHENNVIHRDLKPANIVTGQFGETYVIDWGLARRIGEPSNTEFDENHDPSNSLHQEDSRLTQMGHSMGTPAYMSPEQVRGENIGRPSDIFNLGATLYSILVGHSPYHSDSIAKNLQNAHQASFEAPRSIDSRIPKAIAAICAKAMSLKPTDRYVSALDLAKDVENFLADQPVLAISTPWSDVARRWLQKHRTAVTTIATTALVGLLLLAIGNSLLLNSNRKLVFSEAQARENLYAQLIAVANSEIENNNIVRAREVLHQCPPPAREWEWHLLNSLVGKHKPLISLDFPGDQLRSLALDASGKRVAAGDESGAIRIWDTDDWQLLHAIDSKIAIRKIEFLPGKDMILAVGRRRSRSESRLSLIDLKTREIDKRKIRSQTLTALAVSPDGKHFATGELTPTASSRIVIYDSTSLEPVHCIDDAHDDQINALVIDHKQRILACGADSMITGWSMTGEKLGSVKANNASLLSIDTNRNLISTAGSDNIVKNWRADFDSNSCEFTPLQSFAGHSDMVLATRISPDAKFLATSGMDRDIHLWDLGSARLTETIKRHTSHVRCLEFHPTRPLLFSGGEDRVVNVWDTSRLSLLKPSGWNVEFTTGASENLVVSDGKSVSIWDAQQQIPIVRITDHPAPILGVSGGKSIIASFYFNGTCRLWNSENGKQIGEYGNPEHGAIFDAKLLKDDRTICLLHHRHKIEIIDTQDKLNSFELEVSKRPYRLAASEDGQTLVVATKSGTLEIFDLIKKTRIAEIDVGGNYLLGLSMNPNNDHVAVAAVDGAIRVWDINTRELVCEIQSGSSWLNCVAYTPDGKRIIAGNEHTILCCDAYSGREIVSMTMPRCVHEVAFNRDGSMLALASGRREGVPKNTTPPYIRILRSEPNVK